MPSSTQQDEAAEVRAAQAEANEAERAMERARNDVDDADGPPSAALLAVEKASWARVATARARERSAVASSREGERRRARWWRSLFGRRR